MNAGRVRIFSKRTVNLRFIAKNMAVARKTPRGGFGLARALMFLSGRRRISHRAEGRLRY
jgi:hypothetical protein